MSCTTLPQQESTASPAFTTKVIPPSPITVSGILVEHGKLYVFAKVDGLNRTFLPKARTLTSFLHFQQYVHDQTGVLVTHRSQNAPNSRRRRDEWQAVLETAYDRGCRK